MNGTIWAQASNVSRLGSSDLGKKLSSSLSFFSKSFFVDWRFFLSWFRLTRFPYVNKRWRARASFKGDRKSQIAWPTSEIGNYGYGSTVWVRGACTIYTLYKGQSRVRRHTCSWGEKRPTTRRFFRRKRPTQGGKVRGKDWTMENWRRS